jgi:glycosyltransferase involved in cell wall biosynthesis
MDLKSGTPKPARHLPWNLFGSFENTIGVLWPDYGSGHVIYGLNTRRYTHRTVSTVTLKHFDKRSTFYTFTPLVLDASLPLVHTWNAIPCNKDFIVSFELELPRYLGSPTPAQVHRGMSMLASDRCKKILALSEFALRHATRRLENNGFAQVAKKLAVFRGAIEDPFADDAESARPAREPFDKKPFSAIVIGSQLFRKGGAAAIQAFERLRARGLDVRLTLIGDFEPWCYALREHTPDAQAWRERARSHDWIRFKGGIPRAQVFEELRAHDVCLYPSMDESLGWLTIEAQMLGTPVVGNRVCAYPELIDHGRTGWLIDLPVDADGRWAGISMQGEAHAKAAEAATQVVVEGIEACVLRLFESPQLLAEWSANARRAMSALYGIEQASASLEKHYDRALNRA